MLINNNFKGIHSYRIKWNFGLLSQFLDSPNDKLYDSLEKFLNRLIPGTEIIVLPYLFHEKFEICLTKSFRISKNTNPQEIVDLLLPLILERSKKFDKNYYDFNLEFRYKVWKKFLPIQPSSNITPLFYVLYISFLFYIFVNSKYLFINQIDVLNITTLLPVLIKPKNNKKGYKSYDNYVIIGYLYEIFDPKLDDKPLKNKHFQKLFNRIDWFRNNDHLFDPNKIYSILAIIISPGISKTIGNISFKINRNNPSTFDISIILTYQITINLLKYDFQFDDCYLVFAYKEWLSRSDFYRVYINKDDKYAVDILDKTLQNITHDLLDQINIYNISEIDKIFDISHYADYLEFNNVLNLELIWSLNNILFYKHPFKKDVVIWVQKLVDLGYSFKTYKAGFISKEDISQLNKDFNFTVFIDIDYWIDTIYPNYITRSFKFYNKNFTLTLSYDENNFFKTFEEYINLDIVKSKHKNIKYNISYGVLDIETYSVNDEGLQKPFAVGYKINNIKNWNKNLPTLDSQMFYITDYKNSDDIMLEFINKLFETKIKNFFAHNFARFDIMFILNTALIRKFSIKIHWVNDYRIYKIVIKNNEGETINFLDSFNLLSRSLSDLCKSFKTDVTKGYFPYKFVNENKFNYVGKIPELKYFLDAHNVKPDDVKIYHESLQNETWSLKTNTLNYLDKDLSALLSVLNKFSSVLFEKYNVNITSNVTIASVSLKIYLSMFYSEDKNISIPTPELDKFIRASYFGGGVRVFEHEIRDGYYYDINSMYPYVILKDIPVGDPIFTNNVDLNADDDNFFGFVRADVEVPDESILKYTILPLKNKKTGRNEFPRGNISGVWFSEELKNAIKYGYKVKSLYGLSFDRGKNVFKDYIDHFYKIKSNTDDQVERNLAKLMLNSLYGKWAFRKKYIVTDYVNKDKYNEINKTYSLDDEEQIDDNLFYIKFNSKHLIGDIPEIDEYKDDENNITISSVQISSAVTAYARIEMSKYFNLPDNKCFYSDTDSVILQNILPDHEVGKNLGQIKIEHEIKHGIFIKNKTYCIKNMQNEVIIKAAGVNSKDLTYDDFIKLLNGEDVIIKNTKFHFIFKNLKIEIKDHQIRLKGVAHF